MKYYIFILISLTFSFFQMHGQGFHHYMAQNPDKTLKEKKEDLDRYYQSNPIGRGTGYKHYRRWLEAHKESTHNIDQAQNTGAQVFQAYRKFQKSQKGESNQRATNGEWSLEGPTSYIDATGWNGGTGRVNRLYFHPTAVNTFFACTPAGGLWRTQNGGSSWTCMTDKLPRIGAAGVAIDPNNTNIYYLLTGDADGSDNYSIGLLKSFDAGNTWDTTGLSWAENTSVRVRKLLMHPTNHDTLFVVSSNGIHRTLNAGVTWSVVQSGSFYDIEFQPGDPTRMYATSSGTFWVSTNSGTGWNIEPDTDFPSGVNRVEIGVTDADSTYVYLLFGGQKTGTGSFPGLLRSTDSGLEFSLRSNTPNILGYETDGQDNEEQGFYDLALAVDQTDESIIYIGGINVWKSDDGGSTWDAKSYWKETNNSTGYTHADVHAIEWNGSNLFVGSDGGVFTSSDNAENWTDLSAGLAIMQFYDFDVVNGVISGGTQDNGSNQWVSGSTVATHTLGADGFASMVDFSNTNIRYQSTQEDLFKSVNGGSSFSTINVPGESNYWTVNLAMHPTNPDTIFAGFWDIYRSFNGGSSWDNIGTISPEVVAMEQSPQNVDRMYVVSNDEVNRSDNINAGTPIWVDRTGTLSVVPGGITDIAVDPEDSETVWVSFSGFSAGNKVFMSSDTGSTWTNISGAIPNVPIRSLVSQPGANNGIYAGTSIGIFYRNDQIGNWIYYSNEMPVVPVIDMKIDQNKLYAATYGRGVWSSSTYSSCQSGIFLSQADPGNGKQVYHAQNFINSSQVIEGGLGTFVQYHSPGEVKLTTGFHAKAKNRFKATLLGCPD